MPPIKDVPVKGPNRRHVVYAFGLPMGTTEAAVQGLFPAAMEILFEDDTELDVRTAAMVFPKTKAAQEAAESGATMDDQSLVLRWGGVQAASGRRPWFSQI